MRRLLLLGMLTVCGCSGGESATAVPLDQLPPGYLDKAKQMAPDVEFTTAGKKSDGTYEIQGRSRTGKKKMVEIEIDKDGNAKFD